MLEDLIRLWLGHANKTVTDNYSQLREDAEYRRMVADESGLGFDLSGTLIPAIPSTAAGEAVEIEC